jgi:hypothetical protein
MAKAASAVESLDEAMRNKLKKCSDKRLRIILAKEDLIKICRLSC